MEVIPTARNNCKLSKIILARKFNLPESLLRGNSKNKDSIKNINSGYPTEVKKWSRIQNEKFEILETT